MPEKYYLSKLYPFQDEILQEIQSLDIDFYLSGGTALSRCFLGHRYSDDLDLFLNDHLDFKQQCETVVNHLKKLSSKCTISITAESFLRIFLKKDQLILKIDFINDVAFHFGDLEKYNFFKRIDNWRNILSNKICALSRMEPKDYADILFIAKKYTFNWEDIIAEAKEKDLWVEPIEISRLIKEFPVKLLTPIKWISQPNLKQAQNSFTQIAEDILKGSQNSLQPSARLK
ncbi:MAG: nucleotidyl transferase AbiEii/AbiGii toxin family protein [Desulfobacteraceae bacterium]|nr:nucleotidyl transferase AbiEii/AbiGii toxin family protein [Desulfobacteraceae bacterium]